MLVLMGLIWLCNQNPIWVIYQRTAWLWFWVTLIPQRFANWRVWIELFVALPGLILCGNRSCPRIMKFFFRKCSMMCLKIWVNDRFMKDFVELIVSMGVLRYFSLYLSVCVFFFLFGCWESVWKLKVFEFLDMVFDWLWWGFRLLGIKYGPVIRFENMFWGLLVLLCFGFEKMRERK